MTELTPDNRRTGWTYMCCWRNDRCVCQPDQPPAPQGLAEMTALDEQLDTEHPGWMTGQPPAPQDDLAAIAIVLRRSVITFGGVEQTKLGEKAAAAIETLLAERDDLRALIGENDLIPEGKHAELIVELKRAEEEAFALAQSALDFEAKLAAAEALLKPQWFYAEGYDQDGCHDSPEDVIEYLDFKPGDNVVRVDCAGPLPSLWYVVHVRTDEEMEALGTDDREVFTQYPSEEAALATEKNDDNSV